MNFLKEVLNTNPLIPLFFSLAIGFWIGKIKIGRFELGGMSGCLLAAVIIG
jgi:putative transport protein